MGQHIFFWNWFVANRKRIESHDAREHESVMQEILQQLHVYNDRLFFEISDQESAKEFIITAEGDLKQFTSVNELVERSPRLRNWKFTAFKAGVGFSFYTEIAGKEYDPDELWFLPLSSKSSGENLGLRIGIPDFNDQDSSISEEAMWLILETALGELECAKNIRYVEVACLPTAPSEMGYIELVDLKEFIDWYKENSDTL